jgi:quercetin dioxygenase-like cupin family protein
MAHAGQVIEHPVTGERITFLKTAGDTGGQLLRLDLYVSPHGFVAAAHVHPGQEERFEVRSGRISLKQRGSQRVVSPGEVVSVSPGTPHSLGNPFDEPADVTVEFRPALDTEAFFENFFGLAKDGRVHPKSGMPQGLQLMALAREFRHEVVPPPPIGQVVSVLLAVTAPLAKLLGYRGRYRRYSEPRKEV